MEQKRHAKCHDENINFIHGRHGIIFLACGKWVCDKKIIKNYESCNHIFIDVYPVHVDRRSIHCKIFGEN